MPINIDNYEALTRKAVREFWKTRESARTRQRDSARPDSGERSSVTAGKNMDGFIDLIKRIICSNGLDKTDIKLSSTALTLPGFFRPTKRWDILVIHKNVLIAAIELKSQVGPSFGNNFNNRAEEALGTAQDLWTAFREGAFGDDNKPPFVGWLMLLEDSPRSSTPVRTSSPNYPIFPEFENTSYSKRYNLLCKKMIQERLYTSAALITSRKTDRRRGNYKTSEGITGLQSFVSSLAAHIASNL